jgi:hypothetical protein
MSDDKINLTKKASNCVDETADSFGYSSFGEGVNRIGSLSFFKQVVEWPDDSEINDFDKVETSLIKYNIATIKMSESAMLRLAEFIIEQHTNSLPENTTE